VTGVPLKTLVLVADRAEQLIAIITGVRVAQVASDVVEAPVELHTTFFRSFEFFELPTQADTGTGSVERPCFLSFASGAAVGEPIT